jgi:hypothetical protein
MCWIADFNPNGIPNSPALAEWNAAIDPTTANTTKLEILRMFDSPCLLGAKLDATI